MNNKLEESKTKLLTGKELSIALIQASSVSEEDKKRIISTIEETVYLGLKLIELHERIDIIKKEQNKD